MFRREIFVCEMCCFVMTNEKRQKTKNTYYFYYVRYSLLHLKIIKLAVHCSATVLREQIFSKKRHQTALHAGQTACRTISVRRKKEEEGKCAKTTTWPPPKLMISASDN